MALSVKSHIKMDLLVAFDIDSDQPNYDAVHAGLEDLCHHIEFQGRDDAIPESVIIMREFNKAFPDSYVGIEGAI